MLYSLAEYPKEYHIDVCVKYFASLQLFSEDICTQISTVALVQKDRYSAVHGNDLEPVSLCEALLL